MCDVSYYGYFLTKRDHSARDLTELTYKCFDLIKIYGTASTTSLALLNSNTPPAALNKDGFGGIPKNRGYGAITAVQSDTTSSTISPMAISSATPTTTTFSPTNLNHNQKNQIPNSAAVNSDNNSSSDTNEECTWLHAKNMRTNAFGYISCKKLHSHSPAFCCCSEIISLQFFLYFQFT